MLLLQPRRGRMRDSKSFNVSISLLIPSSPRPRPHLEGRGKKAKEAKTHELISANANVAVTSPQLGPRIPELPLLSLRLLLLLPLPLVVPHPPLAEPPAGLVKTATAMKAAMKHKSNPIRMAFMAKKPTFKKRLIKVAMMV